MAIQDTNNITPDNNGQTNPMTGAGPDVPAERLFQQRLAQVAPPPVLKAPTMTTPGTPGPLMPLPVMPQSGHSQQKDYGLTPYKPKPIPTYQFKSPDIPAAVQGTGHSSVEGTVTVPGNPPDTATVSTPTNIAALNHGLEQISKTLRLQLLSPAVQLTINRTADQNVGLNTEYALGLQTPGDGNHLALVGSLKDLTGLFSQANNAQFFAPMLNSDASVTLKGLQQRHAKALNAEADRVALNHTRAQLKQMETARAPGYQSFKQLYPNLSLSTVMDRSTAWQNGIGANRQADRLGADLNQTYVLGYQLPVKLNNNITVQVPVNLVGPLKDLAQFFLRGGDSWLQASGLIGNKSTGLTPEGVMQRYGVAKTNAGNTFNPDQRSENQIGGTTGQQLSSDIDLSGVTNEETTIPTELPNETERSPFVSVKPTDPSDKEKSDGVIAPQLSQSMQPANPGPEGSNANDPIKASDAESGDDRSQANNSAAEKVDIRAELTEPQVSDLLQGIATVESRGPDYVTGYGGTHYILAALKEMLTDDAGNPATLDALNNPITIMRLQQAAYDASRESRALITNSIRQLLHLPNLEVSYFTEEDLGQLKLNLEQITPGSDVPESVWQDFLLRVDSGLPAAHELEDNKVRFSSIEVIIQDAVELSGLLPGQVPPEVFPKEPDSLTAVMRTYMIEQGVDINSELGQNLVAVANYGRELVTASDDFGEYTDLQNMAEQKLWPRLLKEATNAPEFGGQNLIEQLEMAINSEVEEIASRALSQLLKLPPSGDKESALYVLNAFILGVRAGMIDNENQQSQQ